MLDHNSQPLAGFSGVKHQIHVQRHLYRPQLPQAMRNELIVSFHQPVKYQQIYHGYSNLWLIKARVKR